MIKLPFILLFIAIIGDGYSQVITIQDDQTGQPLEHVTLSTRSPKRFEVTDASGKVDISTFKGVDKIHISHLGYVTVVKNYTELEHSETLKLTSSNVSLNQIVVSASRWSQSSREIPSKITAISTKKATLLNPQTTADLLGISEEVFIQKSQLGGGSPMIRGFSTNRLLYTVDGIRMNTAIFRSGNIQNVISLDPFAIQRTEIFFGPGSVIYGSDAIGGVMSFQTLTPQLSLTDKALVTGNAVGRYSSAGVEKTGHFDIGFGWKKWGLLSSFSYSDFGDLRMGKNGPDDYLRPFYVQRINNIDSVINNENPEVQLPTGYSIFNLMQKLRFKPNENWDVQYGFHYSKTSEYARYDRLIQLKNELPRSAEWNYGPQIWMMNNLDITNSSKSKLYDQMSIRGAYQFFEESRIDRNLNDTIRRNRLEKVAAWSANIDFTKSIHEKHMVNYGLEFVYNDVISIGINENILTGVIAPGAARYPKSSWASYAAYLTYQYKFSAKTSIKTGLRYNYFSLDATFDTSYRFPFTTASINNGTLTGSLGLIYNPNESWSISVNASTGFRSPNVDDMGKVFDSEPGAVVVPNPGLQGEYAYNVEAGIAKVFGKWLKVDATAYYTRLNNAMVRRDFLINGTDSIVYDGELSQVQAIQNAAKVVVYGVQVGLELKLPLGIGLSSRFNFQKGEEELDDGTISPARHAAPMFGGSHLTYSKKRLNLDFYILYNGQRNFQDMPVEEVGKAYLYAADENGNPFAPRWYTLNLKAMIGFNDYFSISAGLENMTNQRYKPYSSGIAAPGINFIVSGKVMF